MIKALFPKNKYIIFSKALGNVPIEIKKTNSTLYCGFHAIKLTD